MSISAKKGPRGGRWAVRSKVQATRTAHARGGLPAIQSTANCHKVLNYDSSTEKQKLDGRLVGLGVLLEDLINLLLLLALLDALSAAHLAQAKERTRKTIEKCVRLPSQSEARSGQRRTRRKKASFGKTSVTGHSWQPGTVSP